MTVREVIARLEQEDPDRQVVLSGGDHQYFSIDRFHAETAEGFDHNELWEYYGSELMDGTKKIEVLVIE